MKNLEILRHSALLIILICFLCPEKSQGKNQKPFNNLGEERLQKVEICLPPKVVKIVKRNLNAEKNKRLKPSLKTEKLNLSPCKNFSKQHVEAQVRNRLKKMEREVKENYNPKLKIFSGRLSVYNHIANKEFGKRLQEIIFWENKIQMEGFWVPLLVAESGLLNVENPISTAKGPAQILWGTGIKLGLIYPDTTKLINGVVCKRKNNGQCTEIFFESKCFEPVDKRHELELSIEKLSPDYKRTIKEWGDVSFGWLDHHQGSTWKVFAKSLATQILMREKKFDENSAVNFLSGSEPSKFLTEFGILNAYELIESAILCGGRSAQELKSLPDNGESYAFRVYRAGEVVKITQPEIYLKSRSLN